MSARIRHADWVFLIYGMALLTISGEPASRWEEVAHGAAQLLKFELVTAARLEQWIAEEFGEAVIPDRAWRAAVVSILARIAVEHHLVIALPGARRCSNPCRCCFASEWRLPRLAVLGI